MTKRKDEKPAAEPGAGQTARLDRDIQLRIGEGLRTMYDDIVKQGVPDRFAELLSKLDQPKADREGSSGK